jgi:dihydroorotase
MAHYDLIIKNATVSTYLERNARVETEMTNIGVLNQKIASLNTLSNDTATTEINLRGLHLLPGVIDSQVHFREPGMTHKEDLESGTRAALMGGVTSIFEMPNTNPSTTTREQFQTKLNLAEDRAHCHYAFFIGGASDNYFELNELEQLPHCSGVKVFLGSSFGNLLVDDDTIFKNILKNGKRRVIIHSEDEARLKSRKQIAIDGMHPRVHHIWRDEESALISTKKSIAFAREARRPVHILHISSAEEMQFLKQNKDIATVEILPQFLTLSAPECYERLGTFAQQNPPIRDKRHMEFLWRALHDGTVDVIGSDHAPHTIEEKNKPYPQSPSGMPGVQTLIPIMLDHVNKNNLQLKQFVQMTTENPRRIFGAKNKGRIAVGFDADFTVIDLKRTEEIKATWLQSKCGWSPFMGMKFQGWPVMSILKGQICMRDSQIVQPHSGQAINFEY